MISYTCPVGHYAAAIAAILITFPYAHRKRKILRSYCRIFYAVSTAFMGILMAYLYKVISTKNEVGPLFSGREQIFVAMGV